MTEAPKLKQQKLGRKERIETKGIMEMGGNNKPALFSRAEDWLLKNSLGISAESVPEQILDHFSLFLIFLDSSCF